MAATNKAVQGKLNFEKDERVLCFHGPLIYEAKILKAEWWSAEEYGADEGPHYFIHYKGWKQTWDEWAPESRILKFTEANLQRQKELQQSYASRKDDKSVKESKTEAVNNKKRQRDSTVEKEDDYLKKPEIRIPIPDSLKVQLVDDWENVTKNQRLVSLPRNPTVAQILEEYRQSKIRGKKEANEDLVNEVLEGLRLYFDRALGTILLYRFERQQYADVRDRYPGIAMSQIYGAEHLLRLFVQLPMLIAHTTMDQQSVLTLKEHLNQIVMFIQKNSGRYFLKEYENAPPEYLAFHRAT